MKRLVVMACYSPIGEVERYKKILIQIVKKYADCLYVVCNGIVSEEAYIFLKQETETVMVRDNVGYDAGAYKDILLKVRLEEYDELLLLNDTFYGFFYSLDEFFRETERVKGVDFWGLTRHPEGKNGAGQHFEAHIQSYFLLIKSRMLHSKDFYEFWENMSYPINYNDAVINFEVMFTKFFQKRKFQGKAYCDLATIGIREEYSTNPSLKYPYELIHFLKYPVIKRKSLCIGNSSVWKALKYVQEKQLYDFNVLWKQVLSDYENNAMDAYFNLFHLESFLSKYSQIYIFGKGVYGIGMYDYLRFRDRAIEKFIVSRKEDMQDDTIITLSELEISENVGIIVALKPQYTQEVLQHLLEKVPREQLFLGKEKRL